MLSIPNHGRDAGGVRNVVFVLLHFTRKGTDGVYGGLISKGVKEEEASKDGKASNRHYTCSMGRGFLRFKMIYQSGLGILGGRRDWIECVAMYIGVY